VRRTNAAQPAPGNRLDAWFIFARLLAAAMLWLVANASAALGLERVKSFQYVISDYVPLATALAAFRDSPVDMMIAGNYAVDAVVSRTPGDPLENKLVIGYIDAAECTRTCLDLYFKTGRPSWFGAPNPLWPDLYTVQFWNPQWRPVIFAEIDRHIAAGYDGVLLDVLDGVQWRPGNRYGNVPYANADAEMARLLADIRAYVVSRGLAKPFYLIGNNASGIEVAVPGALDLLDAVMSECLTYCHSPTDGSVSVPWPFGGTVEDRIRFVRESYRGRRVFVVDYPPLTDAGEVARTFSLSIENGWIPSVTTARQTHDIFRTGPFLLTASHARTTVRGSPGHVNFVSGGDAPDVTLIGGDRGDYFLGGPGRKTVTGGAGDDVIVAHPASATTRNLLAIRLLADVVNTSNPSATVLLNGNIAMPASEVTATRQNGGVQEFRIDTTRFEPVVTLRIEVSGPPYVDANRYANVQLQSITYQGRAVALREGQYSSGARTLNDGLAALLNPGTSVTFGAPTLPRQPALAEPSTATIDGGGGVNTVVYRAPAAGYTITPQPDGSVTVASATTAEGPDVLRNVRHLQFADTRVAIAPGGFGSPVQVVEFYNAGLDHYFVTWIPEEIAALDSGTAIKGWARTGKSFAAYTAPRLGTSPVCRFYIPPSAGDSHFYGRGTAECEATKARNPGFVLEESAFMHLGLPTAGNCPSDTRPVHRVFTNRRDANHRYTIESGVREEMVARGWLAEGDGPDLVVMCAPK
jgi:uncharacterized protein (TIGR01370 family)